MIIKKTFFILLITAGFSTGYTQTKNIKSFPLSAVTLLESPFKEAEQTDLKYILALDPDRLLAPYLREAGLTPKAESYGNWENTGLDGHIGGHYLTALAQMYASTGNKEALKRLNYMLDELKKCQDKNGNGYIGGVPGGAAMWNDIAHGKIDAGAFSLNKKWVPWYNIHKLYSGLRDAYQLTGNEQAKEMLLKLSDWSLKLVSNLSDEQIQQMLHTEYGGMNEIFADVAVLTGNKKYLELAEKFSDKRILDPLAHQQDKLNGLHANTQIPKVIGFKRIADVSGDKKYDTAARFFWETVVGNRTSVIGGNSVREHFHPANDFSSMLTDPQGPETCNSYNMLKLSRMLYEDEGNLKYIDYYERTLYNHILSTQHPDKGGFVYFTPLRPGHYRVYSTPQECFWCCVGSGLENHGKYGELIYVHTNNELFVNLYIASKLNWKEKKISITQQTKFPEEEHSDIIINTKKPADFVLKLRYPGWANRGGLKVKINGKEEKITSSPGSYISINRRWKNGDKVSLELPMRTTVEEIPDKSGFAAVLHGPIVLAAKLDTTDLKGLFADGSRMGHVASGRLVPLQDEPLLVGTINDLADKIKPVKGQPLTFTASDLIYPAKYQDLKLIPFYKLHDARYIIYWKHTEKDKIEESLNALAKIDEKQLGLAAVTVDYVAPGEQQSESDHFFEGEDSQTGVFKNRHWREAKGWFSYRLNNKDKKGSVLQLTYYGQEKDKAFDIFINDIKIKEISLSGSQGDDFITAEYLIPQHIINNAANDILTIRFTAHQNSATARIYSVRLLRKR